MGAPQIRYADLTIAISRPFQNMDWAEKPAQNLYWAEMRYTRPDDSVEKSPTAGAILLPRAELRAAAGAAGKYGQILCKAVFKDLELQKFYGKCVANAAHLDLRLRIHIDRSATDLHSLRWETLFDPEVAAPDLQNPPFLALRAGTPFSRFLSSPDWDQVGLRQKGDLHALVVVANPANLDQFDVDGIFLPEVKVSEESQLARNSLEAQGISVKQLTSDEDRVTLDKIKDRLDQGFDILYLVCHGAMLREEENDDSPLLPWLVLQKETDGTASLVNAGHLAEVIRRLHADKRPRLVMLASCQSGGQGQVLEPSSVDGGALSAAGPLLVDAGVPAVLAMQDNITMDTVKLFVPGFFKNLLEHGQVDRAMAEARSLISTRRDWWVPVLYLRLTGGRLWYEPGFARDDNNEYSWDGLLNNIEKGQGVPVLGFGLVESLFGRSEEIARGWADHSLYPFLPHAQQEMPQVAQYLSLRDGSNGPRDALERYLKEKLQEKCTEAGINPAGSSISDLMGEVSKLKAQDENDPHEILSRLPFTIYINATPDNLLETALRRNRNGCEPQVLYYCWKSELRKPELVRQFRKLVAPTYQRPIVFYLFGVIDEPDSWVMSEDDYFEYLMWIKSRDNNIPVAVQNAWKQNPLLFLGFKMSDWNFRVLYRSILNEDRLREIGVRPKYHSVSVQIQPGDDNLRPEGARNFLKQAFPTNFFDLYWGGAENFLTRLWNEWKKSGRKAP